MVGAEWSSEERARDSEAVQAALREPGLPALAVVADPADVVATELCPVAPSRSSQRCASRSTPS
jgi:hypothetical protein